MNEEKMWEIVKANDPSHDGQFYYAVKTTGIFCRPSCKSKVPNRENVIFFPDITTAIGKGYRPCKRCRPDLGAKYNPDMEVVDQVCQLMEREYANSNILEELAVRVGVSSSHLQRLVKKATGHTPREYLLAIRIARAKELLEKRRQNNTDIALEVGFKSLSGFYAAFYQQTGVTPGEYRSLMREE